MGEVVPAHRPYFPHPLALCCQYPVSKCLSASIVVTSTVRVNHVMQALHCLHDRHCQVFYHVANKLANMLVISNHVTVIFNHVMHVINCVERVLYHVTKKHDLDT